MRSGIIVAIANIATPLAAHAYEVLHERFDPGRPREYQLALLLACLGGLKFVNLNPEQKRRLYLTAAALSAQLQP